MKAEVADKKTMDKKASEKKTLDKKASDKKVSEKKTLDKKASDKKVSEKKTLDKKTLEKKASDKKASDKKASRKKGMGIGAIFFAAVILFLAWCTLHDMQRSEGIGLYYSTVLGMSGAAGMGFAVEMVGLFLLAALVLLPCILFRRLKADSFLRLLTAHLAFMPTISLAYLVHLLNGTEEIKCSDALLAGNFRQAFLEGISGAASMLAAGIPLLLLTAFAIKSETKMQEQEENGERKENGQQKESGEWEETGEQKETQKRKETEKREEIDERTKIRRYIPAAVLLGILLILSVVFPVLKEVCTFFIRYLLLIYGFSLWEYLLEARPQYKSWSWVFFGILGLRGIYTMAEVMSVYHV